MSFTLTITGNKSVLHCDLNPPIILDKDYECGLLYFSTFHSIPNINKSNNIFAYGNKQKQIEIPSGTYDLSDILGYLKDKSKECEIEIKPNVNTLKCALFCSEPINFAVKNSIGPVLGFTQTKLVEPNKWYESDSPVSIIPVSVIQIECDLVQGSFVDGSPSHVIHEFVLNISPGHQIVEVPRNIIYYPLRKKLISSVTVKILDLKGNSIDFQNENIQLSLHLRKIK